jgi:hypothetical protein
LKLPEPARLKVAAPAAPVVQNTERVTAQSSSGESNRLLLIAVAAVCLIALAMRRAPRRAPGPVDPGLPANNAEGELKPAAEVIPLHRAS